MRWTGKFIGDKTLIVSGIILWFEPQTDHQNQNGGSLKKTAAILIFGMLQSVTSRRMV